MRNSILKQKKVVGLFVALMFLMGLASCKENRAEPDAVAWENASENGVTGLGKAFYANGFLYYSDDNYIYEYDLHSEESIALNKDQGSSAVNLYGAADGIYYNTGVGGPDIYRIPFDTQIVENAYHVETDSWFCYVYHEEEIAYGLSMQMGDLIRYQKEMDQAEVVDTEVLMYVKEGENLYYIKYYPKEERTELILLKDGESDKQIIDVGISPIYLSVEGNRLVLSEIGSWQLYDYDLESEKFAALEDVFSVVYQVRGDSLYYVSRDSGHQFTKIRMKSLNSGEERVVCENVRSEFCTMDEDVLVCWDYFYQPLLVKVGEEESEITELPVLAD